MFERFTEKARRTIFFARYEASQLGSPYIETEHILLGLVREDPQLCRRFLPEEAKEQIREKIEAGAIKFPKISTSVDLPISNEVKRVLAYADEEAERLAHRHIGTEHLLLGLLREHEGMAAVVLQDLDVNLEKVRNEIAEWQPEASLPSSPASRLRPRFSGAGDTIPLHGAHRDTAHLHSMAAQYQRQPWHWRQETWHPRDIVSNIASGEISFDLSLADDCANFKLVKGGWTGDNCVVCGWRLFESKILAHGSGYTNGRDWLCIECYEKFFRDAKPGPPSHPDIT